MDYLQRHRLACRIADAVFYAELRVMLALGAPNDERTAKMAWGETYYRCVEKGGK